MNVPADAATGETRLYEATIQMSENVVGGCYGLAVGSFMFVHHPHLYSLSFVKDILREHALPQQKLAIVFSMHPPWVTGGVFAVCQIPHHRPQKKRWTEEEVEEEGKKGQRE